MWCIALLPDDGVESCKATWNHIVSTVHLCSRARILLLFGAFDDDLVLFGVSDLYFWRWTVGRKYSRACCCMFRSSEVLLSALNSNLNSQNRWDGAKHVGRWCGRIFSSSSSWYSLCHLASKWVGNLNCWLVRFSSSLGPTASGLDEMENPTT